MKQLIVILFFLTTCDSWCCQCKFSKGFLGNIRFSELIIYGQVVDSVTESIEGVPYVDKIGIKVLNSFGAKKEHDTIWITNGYITDCNRSIFGYKHLNHYYFALNHVDKFQSKNQDTYAISQCGTHSLETDFERSKAIGNINLKDNILSDIKFFFGIYKSHNNRMNMKRLDKKIYRRIKKNNPT